MSAAASRDPMTSTPDQPPTLVAAVPECLAGPRLWVRQGARFGYLTKGAVYVLVAGLAAHAAATGAAASGPRDVFWTVFERPFGTAALTWVAVGLAAYAGWRVVQGVADTERCGRSPKGLATRTGYVLSGLAHGALVVAAARILAGAARRRRHAGDAFVRGWVDVLMGQPLGRWLVLAVAAGVLGFGVAQVAKAWTGRLTDEGDLCGLSDRRRRRAELFGRAGAAARGVGFGVIGGWLIVAAKNTDARDARGLGGALDTIARQPYGPWLLAAVAVGLLAYGLYQFTLAGHNPARRRAAAGRAK